MNAAYYGASLARFENEQGDGILGQMIRMHGFVLEHQQRDAWIEQIRILKAALSESMSGHIFLEFSIPRMGKRADAVVIVAGLVLVIEFKVGASHIDRVALDQVHDYALDLKNFHRGSHYLPIVPIVVATRAGNQGERGLEWAPDKVAAPIGVNAEELGLAVAGIIKVGHGIPINIEAWERSGYQPTPTIVEAAQALYKQHGVEEISRSDAGAYNLTVTANCIADIIEKSKSRHRKSICLVTPSTTPGSPSARGGGFRLRRRPRTAGRR